MLLLLRQRFFLLRFYDMCDNWYHQSFANEAGREGVMSYYYEYTFSDLAEFLSSPRGWQWREWFCFSWRSWLFSMYFNP